MLRRKNVLAGLMFIAIAAIGLWASRNYPVGTALRMSTGYVPRLLCWLLMGLGAIVLIQGLLEHHAGEPARERTPEDGVIAQLRPVVVVTLGIIAFALTLETLGLVLSIFVLVVIASFATRELKLWETLAAAAGLARADLGDLRVRALACRSRCGRTSNGWNSSSPISPPAFRSR